MRKRLSSYDTLYYQAALPAAWLGLMGTLSYATYVGAVREQSSSLAIAIVMLAFTMATTLAWCCGTLGLKKVVLLGDTLRISGWLRRDRVSLEQIAAIRRGWLLRYLPVQTATLRLHRPCWFGDSITFILTGGKYDADRNRRELELAVARAVRQSKRRERLELEPDPMRDFEDQGDELEDDWDDGLDADDDFEGEDDDEPTIACPYCGAEIHEDAPRCPSCGQYISAEDAPPAQRPWWIVLGVIICLLLVYLWTTGGR